MIWNLINKTITNCRSFTSFRKSRKKFILAQYESNINTNKYATLTQSFIFIYALSCTLILLYNWYNYSCIISCCTHGYLQPFQNGFLFANMLLWKRLPMVQLFCDCIIFFSLFFLIFFAHYKLFALLFVTNGCHLSHTLCVFNGIHISYVFLL